MRYLWLLTFLSCFVQCQSPSAQPASIQSQPASKAPDSATGSDLPAKPRGFVSDYDDLFSVAEEDSLVALLAGFEKKTGAQIVVVSLTASMTNADSLDAFTLLLAKTWRIGRAGINDGVLIGICRSCRRMRIQNGLGIEKILSDADTKQIIDRGFLPDFKAGDYYPGTKRGVTLQKKHGSAESRVRRGLRDEHRP